MADVYLYGHVSTGMIVRLRGAIPSRTATARSSRRSRTTAARPAGSALVLARLGCPSATRGQLDRRQRRLPRDTVAFLESRGIDCSGLVVKPGYVGATEITISDGESRTVFGRYQNLLFTTPQWEPPIAREDRAGADRLRRSQLRRDDACGRRAPPRAAGKPLVSSDVPPDWELAALADTLVISGEMMAQHYPEALESEAAREELFERYSRSAPDWSSSPPARGRSGRTRPLLQANPGRCPRRAERAGAVPGRGRRQRRRRRQLPRRPDLRPLQGWSDDETSAFRERRRRARLHDRARLHQSSLARAGEGLPGRAPAA